MCTTPAQLVFDLNLGFVFYPHLVIITDSRLGWFNGDRNTAPSVLVRALYRRDHRAVTSRWSRWYNARINSEGAVVRYPLNQPNYFFRKDTMPNIFFTYSRLKICIRLSNRISYFFKETDVLLLSFFI